MPSIRPTLVTAPGSPTFSRLPVAWRACYAATFLAVALVICHLEATQISDCLFEVRDSDLQRRRYEGDSRHVRARVLRLNDQLSYTIFMVIACPCSRFLTLELLSIVIICKSHSLSSCFVLPDSVLDITLVALGFWFSTNTPFPFRIAHTLQLRVTTEVEISS